MWQNFTSVQTQKANFDFLPGFVGVPLLRRERLRLHVHLNATRVYLQLLSALLNQTVLANFLTLVETGLVPPLDWGGIPQECVSGRLSHSFLCCQPKWNVMSCQENCEGIPELSGVPSVTFGAAGSWCLPGASDPNWGLCRAQQAAEARCHLLSLSLCHFCFLPVPPLLFHNGVFFYLQFTPFLLHFSVCLLYITYITNGCVYVSRKALSLALN